MAALLIMFSAYVMIVINTRLTRTVSYDDKVTLIIDVMVAELQRKVLFVLIDDSIFCGSFI